MNNKEAKEKLSTASKLICQVSDGIEDATTTDSLEKKIRLLEKEKESLQSYISDLPSNLSALSDQLDTEGFYDYIWAMDEEIKRAVIKSWPDFMLEGLIGYIAREHEFSRISWFLKMLAERSIDDNKVG